MKKKSHKLQPKFTGLYTVEEKLKKHTCVKEQHDCRSREAESSSKVYSPAENPAGRGPSLVEPTRELKQKRIRGRSYLSQQSGEEEAVWLLSKLDVPAKDL